MKAGADVDATGGMPPVRQGWAGPVLAVLGPTATGKSRLAVELALRWGGEIVSCDSTAVYRGFDIGTDKVPPAERRGVPHHLVDVADPGERFTAAAYARLAAAAVFDIARRGRTPIVVGGTGFYYQALTRGLFPGPGRDEALRGRLERVAESRGSARLHRLLARVDPVSARRIQPGDRMRLVRALEVYCVTGRSLTDHFSRTESPLAGVEVRALALGPARPAIASRVSARVDRQFDRGLVGEVRALLASGVPADAPPFSGLVYRQVLELLHGVRDETATRTLIVRENMRYVRRQFSWFRRDQTLTWLEGFGDQPEALETAERVLHLGPRAVGLAR